MFRYYYQYQDKCNNKFSKRNLTIEDHAPREFLKEHHKRLCLLGTCEKDSYKKLPLLKLCNANKGILTNKNVAYNISNMNNTDNDLKKELEQANETIASLNKSLSRSREISKRLLTMLYEYGNIGHGKSVVPLVHDVSFI